MIRIIVVDPASNATVIVPNTEFAVVPDVGETFGYVDSQNTKQSAIVKGREFIYFPPQNNQSNIEVVLHI